MIDVRHRLAEQFAVATDTAQAGTRDVHTVVAAGTADHFGLGRLPLETPVGANHLHRRIGALGTGVGEEHMIETARRQAGDFLRQLERQRMTILEPWRVIEGTQLLGDRVLDFLAGVPGAAGPQTRQRVIDLAPVFIDQPTALGTDDQARVALKVAVGGVRHPVGIEFELAGQRTGRVFGHVHRQNLARFERYRGKNRVATKLPRR